MRSGRFRFLRRAALGALMITALAARILADATPQTLSFAQDWTNTGLIATSDDWSGVAGIEGFRGDGLASTGADPRTVLAADDPGVIDVNANQASTGFTTGGVAEFELANPVVALQGSGTADAPYLRLTVSTMGVTGVRVRYNVRDIDGTADNAVQQVALHYRVGTSGSWTNVPAAYVADATTGPSLATVVTPVDVTLPAAVDNQPIVQLRIMTADAAGSDEWVGIDDFVVELDTAPRPPAITAASGTPSPVEQGQTLVIAAQVAPGANPPSTTLDVTADATAVGGAAGLPLLDNGLAPDAVAGDRIFTSQVVVAAASTGATNIALEVVDDLGRSGGGTLVVEVIAPVQQLAIHDIQGPGISSPFAGQTVRTTGLVTARRSNGVYLQTPDAEVDADPATSEGIFVFTSSSPAPELGVGTAVTVTGVVAEFGFETDPAITEITGPTFAADVTPGNPLPAPVTLTTAVTSPAGGLFQLERYEGMLVQAPSLTVVAPSQGNVNETTGVGTNTGVFYAVLTGIARPEREAGIEALNVVPPCAAGTGCTIPIFDQNPERLRVDSDAISGVPAAVVTTGAVLANVVGVMDYGFRTWTILPTSAITPGSLAIGVAARARGATEFTVASFNLQRVFDTVDDPAIGDPVPTADAYQTKLAKLSAAIRGYLHTPDILGVQEAENITVLQDLAARIEADALAASEPPPGYTAHLVEGNDIGGIDVGFLKASQVTVSSVVQHGAADTFVDPTDGSMDLLNDRPSLSLHATVAAVPGTLPAQIVVVVNHLRSLNGLTDVPDGARVRAKRQAQGEYVANLLSELRGANPGVPVVSVGDYNAFEVNDGHVDVLGIARGVPAPATHVVAFGDDFLTPDFALAAVAGGTPAGETYSYVFDGNAQTLDHILLSPEAVASLTAFDHARINADFPEVYRGDVTRIERTSDHDPAIAYFAFPRDTTPPVVMVPANLHVPAQGPLGAIVTWTATATDAVDGPRPVTCTPPPDSLLPYGATTVVCQASDLSGNTGAASFTVTVVDPATAGLVAGLVTFGRGAPGGQLTFAAARTSGGDTGATLVGLLRPGPGLPVLFAATRIVSVGLYDDPASSPGALPASGVDTTRVTGAATLNGQPGFRFEFVAADRGEPGAGRDTVSLVIRSAAGVVVGEWTGPIGGGNVDSLPIW